MQGAALSVGVSPRLDPDDVTRPRVGRRRGDMVPQVFEEQTIPRRHGFAATCGGGARAWWGYRFTRPGEVRLPA